METISVDLGPDGLPVSFTLEGRTWLIGAEPLRWFERRPWWETDARMGREAGEGRIDVEVWRLQARIGRNPSNDLITFEVVHGNDDSWVVRSRS